MPKDNKSSSLGKLALQRFKKNLWGVLSFWYILICAFLAIFAYVFAPDDSRFANQMHLSIHSQPPGFQVTMLTIPSQVGEERGFWSQLFFGKENTDTEMPVTAVNFVKLPDRQSKIIAIPYTPGASADTTAVMPREISMDLFPDNLSPSGIKQNYIQEKLFLLGTDKYGRDLLSRVLIGMRISLSIGFVAVFISLLIGIGLGAVAGFYGGKIDAAIMWLINVAWSIPTLLLVIAITLAIGKGFWQVFIAVGLTMWVEVARVVRGQVMAAKEQQYVMAARALGYRDFRIILKHILPNVMAPVIVISAANFASAILIESGLSFLGIGAQPPMPSWGAMIKDHYSYIILGKAYLAVIPGLAIMSLVMAFMLIGNALRDALDVKG